MSGESIIRTEDQVRLTVQWGDAERTPVVPANQFLAAVGLPASSGEPDGVQLVVGYLSPPLFTGSADEIRSQLEAIQGKLNIGIQARLLLPRGRVDDLISVLQSAAQQYDETRKQLEGGDE